MLKRNKLLVCFLVVAIAAVAYAATVDKNPYGIASPRYYSMTYGDTSSQGTYYLEFPTLTGNDQFMSEDSTQTVTNKTLTAPVITSPVVTTAVAEKTADYSVTAGETGKTFSNEGAAGAVEFDLPTASTGLLYCFANVESTGYTIYVDPQASDQILGLTNAAGDRAEAGENDVGHAICLEAADEVYWIIRGYYGASWADADS